ncbi:hypothetical protein GH811_15275 [Acetobacterium malicum]|uniref:Preprotein translocase subunit SecB n=1 Tax=Acetobacterium malicum TaxID=52692 RepID=A0ABR6Z0E5_9FIRM|nr:protein-export chaperone SecB [Acetobacterium malicum]MBC3900977.1 hypothetical protein [Acetobacterium malicum]
MGLQSSSFQFKSPDLKKIGFEIRDDFYNPDFKGFNIIDNQLSIDENTECENSAIVTLEVIIGEKTSKFPYYLIVVMESEFTWDKDLPKDMVPGFLSVNAPTLLLSYARPIVASITNSSKYPILNIPFINFQEMFESGQAEITENI